MKRLFKAALRPVVGLLTTITLNIVICSLLFEKFERGDHGPVGQLYWAVTTGTTTGYGDLLPETLAGRLLSIWLMFSSLALFAVATGQIAAALVADPHLFSHEEQEELKDDNDDILTMCVLICHKLDIPVPESVEEASAIINRKAVHDTATTNA